MSLPAESRIRDYKYIPLSNPDTFRLLRLQPAITESLDLMGQLVEVDFPQYEEGNEPEHNLAKTQGSGRSQEKGPRDYEAVSWCWGREDSKELLIIQESDRATAFYISPSLKSALLALRHYSEVRQLWIDAICINQKDTKERSQQVPRMDKIYGNAWAVCVWLGPEDEDSKMAMDFIKHRVVDLWEFDKLVDDPAMARQWAAFVALMKRPWFSRRWVIQEIALASSRSLIYCGKETLLWRDFEDAVSLIVKVESCWLVDHVLAYLV